MGPRAPGETGCAPMSDAVAELIGAAKAVGRVSREGAYTNVVVAHTGPDPVGRIRALVYEAVRKLDLLDEVIGRLSARPLHAIDAPVLDLLRVALIDLESHTPPEIVVDRAVRAAHQITPRGTGFVNAVLRRAVVLGPKLGVPPMPPWLRERLDRAWGPDETTEFWVTSMGPSPTTVRMRNDGPPEPGMTQVAGIEHAWYWPGGSVPDHMEIQDPASVAVGLSVNAEPGWVVTEIGAAPGGKTLHLLDQGASVIALDSHPRRVRSGAKRAPAASWVIGDGARPPLPTRRFDAVLVDAPCTGFGTLRRRPEIRLRMSEEDVQRLSQLQMALVDSALDLVRPGGRVVYSVCTVTPEETIEVVGDRGFTPPRGLPGRVWGDGLLLAPHLTQTDGMFIAVFENR